MREYKNHLMIDHKQSEMPDEILTLCLDFEVYKRFDLQVMSY